VRCVLGPRWSRFSQQAECQCRRSSRPSSGQATTCGVAGRISWSQPGQRYALVELDPVILRTLNRPSGCSSRDSELGRSSRSFFGSTARLCFRGLTCLFCPFLVRQAAAHGRGAAAHGRGAAARGRGAAARGRGAAAHGDAEGSEEPRASIIDAAKFVIIQDQAVDATVSG